MPPDEPPKQARVIGAPVAETGSFPGAGQSLPWGVLTVLLRFIDIVCFCDVTLAETKEERHGCQAKF